MSASPAPPPAPAVDVVIPTYNRADLLPEAVASIQRQTVRVASIFIVDDGSTDDSVAWIERAAQSDPRIVLIRQQHGGANRARNAGIARSGAPWIAFLDSDDAWEADKLERQFALLAAMPEAVGLFCGFRLVGGAVERVHVPRNDPSLRDLRCANALGSTSGAVIRTQTLRDIGGFDPLLPSCQDWDLWFRVRQQGRIAVARAPLVRFNCGPHERITTAMQKVLDGHRTLFTRMLDGVESASERALIRARHQLVEADIRRRFGAHGPAMWLATRSFLSSPSKWALAMAWRAGKGALAAAGNGGR